MKGLLRDTARHDAQNRITRSSSTEQPEDQFTELPFLAGLGASALPLALLVGVALIRREFGAVLPDLVVLLGIAAVAINASLFFEFVAGSPEARNLFTSALGFGTGCAVSALLRALFTPHPDRVVLVAMILSAGSAVPLGYIGLLLMATPAIPGATLSAIAGAWSCHRIADGYASKFLGFTTGVIAGVITVFVSFVPASMLGGIPFGLLGIVFALKDLGP